MQFELIFFPFICFASLVAANLNQRVREDIALSSVIAWLAACNLIQGINAIIWTGNSQLHAPVWCDIGIYRYFNSTFGVV